MNSNTISEFKNRLENLKEIFEIDNKIKKIKNLDLVSSDENFWNDQEKAQKILKEQGELKSLVNSFKKLNDEFDDVVVMYDFFECKEISENEMINHLSKFEKSIKDFEFKKMLNKKEDKMNAILNINPGAGGTESQDWAEMIMRMYLMWGEKNSYNTKIIDLKKGDVAGIKSATIEFEGNHSFGFLKGEKFNLLKTIGLLIGFSGIVFLFSDDFLINENNFVAALLILLGSTCYVIGGVITLKISNKENENVTGSILIWSTIILLPFTLIFEKPWMLNPSTDSIISVIYLGIFPTGIAWLLRFRILKTNGLIFHSQVSYIIPIFGIILGYIFLNEIITSKIIVALIAVFIGIYLARKADYKNVT